MPTAQMLEWKTESIEVTDWTDAKEPPTTWGEPRTRTKHFAKERLEDEIAQANSILTLGDDWDGEGSAGYSRGTFDRAIRFVSMHIERLWETYGIEAPIPKVGAGPEGSIDLHWQQPTWELLVNIPADAHEMAVFYGDNYGSQKIKGTLNPASFNLGIAEWLAS